MESNKTALVGLPKGCAGSDLTMCVRPWSRLDTKVGVQTVTGPGTDRVQAPFRSFIPEAFYITLSQPFRGENLVAYLCTR